MKSIIIRDLAHTAALDSRRMGAIVGGTLKGCSPCASLGLGMFDASQHNFSFAASQGIEQSQNTLVNNGNNVAFASGITSTVKPTQTANNNINFG